VLTLLETILHEQRHTKRRLDAIEASAAHSSNAPSKNMSLPESITIPAKSWNELKNIDKALENQEVFQKMVSSCVTHF